MKGYLEKVDELLSDGTPLERIEEEIEEMDLPPDNKSAVWLYAWVESDRAERRQAVAELLGGRAHAL